MSTQCPTPATKTSSGADPRRMHRRVVVLAGTLAITGAALAAFVGVEWVSLAAIGGFLLLLYPDANCCSR